MGEQKPVAHICHGALALAAAEVLDGRRTAAYPALAANADLALELMSLRSDTSA